MTTALATLVAFLVVLTPIVFVHELGHFWIARLNGVRVETFSIGFGRELFGWNDRHGTRWKFSLLPLGGYVKFWGDASAASNPAEALARMTPEERRVSLHGKNVWQRSAVVAAGPIANFIFAIVVFAGVFMTFGQSVTPPVIGGGVEGSAAEAAGLKVGDRILAIDGSSIDRFEELRAIVALHADTPLELRLLREGKEIVLTATPRRAEVSGAVGRPQKLGRLGIAGGRPDFVLLGPVDALWQGVRETGAVITTNLTYLKRWISGAESGDQISGPIGIAKVAGEVALLSPLALISLMATLSVAIGFINLFPIPMLDGGHLLFYAVEAVRGRPLGERAQEIGFRIGLAMILLMFLFGTWNDIGGPGVFKFVTGLFS